MTAEDRFWRASDKSRLGDLADRLSVSPAEAVKLTGLSRSTIYNLLLSGELHSVTVGSRRLIPTSALRKLVGE